MDFVTGFFLTIIGIFAVMFFLALFAASKSKHVRKHRKWARQREAYGTELTLENEFNGTSIDHKP